MFLCESNEQVINLYNKLTGRCDGREVVSNLIRIGISRNDLSWAINCIAKEHIPEYELINAYKEWKQYAIPYYVDIEQSAPLIFSLSYKSLLKSVDDAHNYYTHLNEIYNDGKTTVIAIKTYHHASLLPPDIKKNWCICKMESRFNEFLPQCGAYLLVTTPSLNPPYQNVIAVVNGNMTEYWDENNQRMSDISPEEEQRLVEYESMLNQDAVEKINTYKGRANENCNITTEKMYRLTEKQITDIVYESVKKAIGENRYK